MSREFCPKDCRNINKPISECSKPTLLSDARYSHKDNCFRLSDKALSKPIPAQVKKGGEWVDSKILGHNGDEWIVSEGNWDIEPTITYINKNAPFIRKHGKRKS